MKSKLSNNNSHTKFSTKLNPPTQNISDLVKIGQAAKTLGVSIDTLRRWEKKGKISTVRTPGGTRLYSIDLLNKLVGGGKKRNEKVLSPSPTPSLSPPIFKSIDDVIINNKKVTEDHISNIINNKQESSSNNIRSNIYAGIYAKIYANRLVFFTFTLIIMLTALLGIGLLSLRNDAVKKTQQVSKTVPNVLAVTTSPNF